MQLKVNTKGSSDPKQPNHLNSTASKPGADPACLAHQLGDACTSRLAHGVVVGLALFDVVRHHLRSTQMRKVQGSVF